MTLVFWGWCLDTDAIQTPRQSPLEIRLRERLLEMRFAPTGPDFGIATDDDERQTGA